MKDLILGLFVGAAIGYVVGMAKERGTMDDLCDEVNDLGRRTKRLFKNAVDKTKNQAEYLKDSAEYEINKAQSM